jgi:hypothetical protein
MADLPVFIPLGYVQLTLVGATGLSPIPQSARAIEVIVEAQGIRYRDDGVAPTAAIGMPVAVGIAFQYSGNLAAIQFIGQAGGAIINVSFYR